MNPSLNMSPGPGPGPGVLMQGGPMILSGGFMPSGPEPMLLGLAMDEQDPFYSCTFPTPFYRRPTPYMGQPDYRIYELNKRLQHRTEVST